jgi:NAD(P)-dependent dehydrogenase (short-subunit alcohol dehydrogenase family)
LTVDGMETTFAVNYLSYFLLTNLLVDLLKRSAPSRVINTASQIHRAVNLDFDNLKGEKFFNRDFSYAQSKLADILFTYELARRLEGTGVTANCVCPGAVATGLWRTSSKFLDNIMKIFMKGPAEGACIPIYLASSPEMNGISSRYYQTNQHLKFSQVNVKNAQAKSSKETYGLETAGRLWEVSKKLTGLEETV